VVLKYLDGKIHLRLSSAANKMRKGKGKFCGASAVLLSYRRAGGSTLWSCPCGDPALHFLQRFFGRVQVGGYQAHSQELHEDWIDILVTWFT